MNREDLHAAPQDRAVAAIGWRVLRDEATARALAAGATLETGLGAEADSMERLRTRVRGALSDLHGRRTLGLIAEDPELGLRKFAKPIGLVAALTPSTAPVAAMLMNALTAVKTRNAVVFCPNPSARRSALLTVALIREALEAAGAPPDLAIRLENPDRDSAAALAAAADLVVASGGAATVRRAALSGSPAYTGGPGNAIVIVDETADCEAAADMIARGKAFDNGTSCSSESNLLAARAIAPRLWAALRARGVHICGGYEEGEKLSPIMGLRVYEDFDEALALTLRLLQVAGLGHSCGIHSSDEARILRLAEAAPVSRIMVRQSTGEGNSGSFSNGMPFTSIVSCGGWGSSPVSENVNWRHFLNYTWVSRPIRRPAPSLEELMRPYLERPAAPSSPRAPEAAAESVGRL